MRCISLWQPWATLIAIGAKQIETRSWRTPYRGWLAIHAAKRLTREQAELVKSEPFQRYLSPDYADAGTWPLGAIVAVVELVRIVPAEHVWFKLSAGMHWPTHPSDYLTVERDQYFGDYSAGRFGWILSDPTKLHEPIPLRGQQGIWELSPDVEAEVRRQMEV